MRVITSLCLLGAASAFVPSSTRWTRPSVTVFGDFESGEVVDRTTEMPKTMEEECELSEEDKCREYQARKDELEVLMKEAQYVTGKIESRNLDDECMLSTSEKCEDYRRSLAALQKEIAKATANQGRENIAAVE